MAEIVLGLATSHSPQVTIHWSDWGVLRHKDETDPRMDYVAMLRSADPAIAEQVNAECWRERYEATQRGIAALSGKLEELKPDVVLVLGDDQHEQFWDNNLPVIAIYHGETIPVTMRLDRKPVEWKQVEEKHWADTLPSYPAHAGLGKHLIRSLVDQEFDVTRSNQLREEIGVGHAFSFLYRRIWPGTRVPMVPIMLNTYYPPNQPTPKRCYDLGAALRRSIEAWEPDLRVAVMASGGLSHTVMDEALDRQMLDAMQRKDVAALHGLPRERLRGGTSEILNWVAVAGAMESTPMQLVDYIPGYRSPAGTGCGMAFAYWQ